MTKNDIDELRAFVGDLVNFHLKIKRIKKKNIYYITSENLKRIEEAGCELSYVIGYEESKMEREEELARKRRSGFKVYYGGKK